MEGLPPGVTQRQNGSLFRTVIVQVAGGRQRDQVREVTLDPDEARTRRIDYHHPILGWIREGYKLEKDRDTQAIMDDATAGQAVHEEDRTKERTRSLTELHEKETTGAKTEREVD